MDLSMFAFPDWLFPVVLWSAAILFIGTVIIQALRPKYRRIYGGTAILWSLWHAILPSIWVQIYLWLALIVLWTPVWWTAVLVAELSSLWTATGWFVMAFIPFYGWWLIRGLTGNSVNREFDATLEHDNAPAEHPKRVAVIGAGMAGLVAAKELREEGHEVVVFERTSGPGGVWASSKARGGVAWGSTMTSSGALNTVFSDAPTQVFHPGNDRWPHHFNRAQFAGFLKGYAERHRVFANALRCNAEIVGMSQLPGERWRLTVRDTTDETTSAEDF
ncbi:MAG: FAD-dependent oxidoreductase, partial [Pseudomonadota bacterium]